MRIQDLVRVFRHHPNPCKVGAPCVFPMVIWPKFRMGEYGDDDHRVDTPGIYENWVNKEILACEHIPVTLFKTSEIVITIY